MKHTLLFLAIFYLTLNNTLVLSQNTETSIKPLFINNKIIRMESIIDNYIKTSLFLEGE